MKSDRVSVGEGPHEWACQTMDRSGGFGEGTESPCPKQNWWELAKFDEGVRASDSIHLRPIQTAEFLLQLLEVLICKFLWIPAFGKSKVANARVDNVVEEMSP